MEHQFADLFLRPRSLDTDDPLSGFRDRFYTPHSGIYMDGNSMGLLSVDSEKSLLRVLDEWKNKAIGGWIGGDQFLDSVCRIKFYHVLEYNLSV